MDIQFDLQIAKSLPANSLDKIKQHFTSWLGAIFALANINKAVELSIRVVDKAESAELNKHYRQKQSPTNVLSFPADLPAELQLPLLGDLVFCAPLIQEEAAQQGKSEIAHWAHLLTHGCLHLLGYDHQDEQQAAVMENLEIKILSNLGFDNPY